VTFCFNQFRSAGESALRKLMVTVWMSTEKVPRDSVIYYTALSQAQPLF